MDPLANRSPYYYGEMKSEPSLSRFSPPVDESLPFWGQEQLIKERGDEPYDVLYLMENDPKWQNAEIGRDPQEKGMFLAKGSDGLEWNVKIPCYSDPIEWIKKFDELRGCPFYPATCIGISKRPYLEEVAAELDELQATYCISEGGDKIYFPYSPLRMLAIFNRIKSQDNIVGWDEKHNIFNNYASQVACCSGENLLSRYSLQVSKEFIETMKCSPLRIDEEKLRIDSYRDIPRRLLEELNFQGVIVSEAHDQTAPKKFIMENMKEFRRAGVEILYIELLEEAFQKDLDRYFEQELLDLPPLLEAGLKSIAPPFLCEEYSYVELVKRAKKEGVRVVALETAHSIMASYDAMYGCQGEERSIELSASAYKIFRARQEKNPLGKYLILCGSIHGVQSSYGIPGFSEMLQQPCMTISGYIELEADLDNYSWIIDDTITESFSNVSIRGIHLHGKPNYPRQPMEISMRNALLNADAPEESRYYGNGDEAFVLRRSENPLRTRVGLHAYTLITPQGKKHKVYVNSYNKLAIYAGKELKTFRTWALFDEYVGLMDLVDRQASH